MKNIIVFLSLLVFVSSCSMIGLTNAVSPEQSKYVKEIIACDSGAKNYTILNDDELSSFLTGDEYGTLIISYQFQKKKGVKLKRKVKITKTIVNNNAYYLANFNSITFPGSACNKLKKTTKHL